MNKNLKKAKEYYNRQTAEGKKVIQKIAGVLNEQPRSIMEISEKAGVPVDNPDIYGVGLVYNLGLFLSHGNIFDKYWNETLVIETQDLFKWPYDSRTAGKEKQAEVMKIVKEREQKIESEVCSDWFADVGGYVMNITFPKTFPQEISEKIRILKEQCETWRIEKSNPKRKDVKWALDEAKEILRLIDEHIGIKTVKKTIDETAEY